MSFIESPTNAHRAADDSLCDYTSLTIGAQRLLVAGGEQEGGHAHALLRADDDLLVPRAQSEILEALGTMISLNTSDGSMADEIVSLPPKQEEEGMAVLRTKSAGEYFPQGGNGMQVPEIRDRFLRAYSADDALEDVATEMHVFICAWLEKGFECGNRDT